MLYVAVAKPHKSVGPTTVELALLTLKLRTELVHVDVVATTVTAPDVNELGVIVTLIEVVPCPEVIAIPVGTVQV